MAKSNLEVEGDWLWLETHCMHSVAFLFDITDAIFSEESYEISVGAFYDEWLKQVGAPRPKITPFNPGVFNAYLYVGILLAKERWFDLLPDEPIDKSEPDWGLHEANVTAPKEPNPTIRYVVRRIRNSLGHARHDVNIAPDFSPNEILSKVTWSFHDVKIQKHFHENCSNSSPPLDPPVAR